MPERRSAVVSWVVAGAAVVAMAGAIGAVVALLPSPAPVAVVTPTATSTPIASPEPVASPAATPSAQGANSAGHVLVQVGEDLVEHPPPYEISVKADDTVVSATALGEYDGEYLYGALTANDQIYITAVTPADGSALGRAVDYDEFAANGVTLDGEKWSVTWFADGTVVWDVI